MNTKTENEMSDLSNIHIQLTQEQLVKVQVVKTQTGHNTSEIIQLAINQYLDQAGATQ